MSLRSRSSGSREAERPDVLSVTTTKPSTCRVEFFRLSSKIALGYISPHGKPFPHRRLSQFVARREEGTCKKDRDHRLAGSIFHFKSPGDRRSFFVQPAEDLSFRGPSPCLEVFRSGILWEPLFSPMQRWKCGPSKLTVR